MSGDKPFRLYVAIISKTNNRCTAGCGYSRKKVATKLN